jgi:cyclopropane-fatty-acyl-phospholipid synthase
MRTLLMNMLSRLICEPRVDVVFADGTLQSAGRGAAPEITLRIADRETEFRLALDPELALGEAVMDGRVIVERGTIYQLLETLIRGLSRQPPSAWADGLSRLRTAIRRLKQHNTPAWARSNVHHHYDLKSEFFRLFLDRDRQYSCAYFETGGETLEEAQAAKKRHIAAKLLLDRPGLEVLDIGSGWGGTAIALARDHGARVTGITLSAEQLDVSRARAAEAGVADRVRFELMDYRAWTRPVDRIVSVGMFEHVGLAQYRGFFRMLRGALRPDGVALLHAIGRADGPGATNPWIRKYIFPGAYIPALSEVAAAVEKEGLIVTDVEVLRLHYAQTLKAWRERFLAHRQEAVAMYDERFARMWEFYLAASEASFRHDGLVVFQLQLAKRLGTLPMTRDYMSEKGRVAETVDRAA